MASGRGRGIRVRILCEDRRTERFLRKLCQRYDVYVLSSEVAPSGDGDASVWVRKSYASSVRLLRASRHQKSLGLIAAIDGDNKGVHKRKLELANELDEAGLPERGAEEPIAIFVPTWSIETWLAQLCGHADVTEAEPLKDHPSFRGLWKDGKTEAATISKAVAAWREDTHPTPSLADAYLEAPRVGI